MEAAGPYERLVSVSKTTRRYLSDSRNVDHIKHCSFNDHVPPSSVYKTNVSVIIFMEGNVSTELEPERAVPITGHLRS